MMPLHLLTGFLGSGKTTLLRRVLADPAMADTAVIVNEFGEIGLDHHLVTPLTEAVLLLNSGCLCCSIRQDLARGLRGLLAQRQNGTLPAFARIVLETTGLADPGPILATLAANPLIAGLIRLGAIVTTVDGLHGERQLDERIEPLRQAAVADRLIVTKSDLASPAAIARLAARLRRINPQAPIEDAVAAPPAPAMLFAEPPATPRSLPVLPESLDHGHDHRIRSVGLESERPLDWHRTIDWLDQLTDAEGDRILRCKGILDIAGQDRPVAIHGVHHNFYPPTLLERWPGPRRSQLVFILQDWPDAELAGGLAACAAG
jgi:G3E family GTPase